MGKNSFFLDLKICLSYKKTLMTMSSKFFWRRIHSLMGLWLILYLSYHLLVNSQAAIWLGNDSAGFVRLVNTLENLPYLHVIEWLFIGIPLLVHGIWGVKRALESKINSVPSSGNKPSLPYERNRAFTWQRLTSWVLLFGILFHVIQMRFLEQPRKNEQGQYWVQITQDPKLESLAERLGAQICPGPQGELILSGDTPGVAILFMVRETFKNLWMQIFYTLFVISAAFHAFNGFWTALLTWGVLLSYRSQRALIPVGWIGAFILSFLGLLAIWGT